MSVDPAFLEHVRDLLAGLGFIRVKRMFGGAGLYADEVFLAVAMDDVLYLKVDELNRAAFEAAGARPFSFEKSDGSVVDLSYWAIPEPAMDDPDEALRWARLAVEAGRRKAARKTPRKLTAP